MSEEIKYIIDGYKKFRQKYFDGNNSIFEDLKNGQNPKILVIACSDSRVDPTIILNCKPGDLFVVRNVANLVPPYENDDGHHGTSAALEFAVCGLNVNTSLYLVTAVVVELTPLLATQLKCKKKTSSANGWN